jgi:proteasome lid subunit RPN8/RPN11
VRYSYTLGLDISRQLDEILSTDVLIQIYNHAQHFYPDECCGLLLKQGVRPCTNILKDLHKADPSTYPRSAAEGFVFSSEDALFLSKNINSDNPVKIIYHSHPDVGAYFSDEDKQNALFDGEPIYPVDHLVIDVQTSGVNCSKLFRFINGDYELIAILPGNNDK